MKMGFIFSGVFWGIVLMLIGLSIVVKVVFHVDIPIVRIILALFFLYLGLKILVGSFHMQRDTVIFNESNINVKGDNNKYNIMFGKGTIDLSNISLENGTANVEVNTVFGASVLKIDPKIPARIVVNSAFSGARMPDGNIISFGDYIYKTAGYKEDKKCLKVLTSVVFGSLEILEK